MRKAMYIFLIGATSSAAATYWSMRSGQKPTTPEAMEGQAASVSKEGGFLTSTKYTEYLSVGKRYLSGNMKFIAASLTRNEVQTQVIDHSILGVGFTGAILISYRAEYSFGFDLHAEQYEITSTPTGIEVQARKPTLLATPAVTNLKYQILSGSLLIDEKAAVLKLYELAASRATAQGTELASDPAVMALCEKKLTQFLREFLAKQPGVTVVPNISIVYASPKQAG